jgi:hypothetical protein
MINRLIGGFVGVLIGVSLISPIATEVNRCGNAAGNPTCFGNLSATSSWAPTVINLVPGFFALGILGIGLAVCYGALQDAGVV